MGMIIRILGTPAVERDGGGVVAPRGRKSWGLLGFLALSETPPSRHRLASLLFPEAQDPLGALRWTTSALRRLLGSQGVIEGDPLRLDLPGGTMLDTEEAFGEFRDPGVQYAIAIAHCDPRVALVENVTSDQAGLIVIGSRGEGQFRGIGGTASYLARHSPVPLAVIP